MLALLAKKQQVLDILFWVPGPTSRDFSACLTFIFNVWMIKPYYHTKPKPSGCFGWKTKQALKDAYRALWCGPYYIALRNPFAFYEYANSHGNHHNKPEPSDCFGCCYKDGPLKIHMVPWGLYILTKGTHSPLRMYEWSSSITTPSNVCFGQVKSKPLKVAKLHMALGS